MMLSEEMEDVHSNSNQCSKLFFKMSHFFVDYGHIEIVCYTILNQVLCFWLGAALCRGGALTARYGLPKGRGFLRGAGYGLFRIVIAQGGRIVLISRARRFQHAAVGYCCHRVGQ